MLNYWKGQRSAIVGMTPGRAEAAAEATCSTRAASASAGR